MRSKEKNYKLSGLLFSIVVHALTVGFIFISSSHLFKGQATETPVEFYVYPSLNKNNANQSNHAKTSIKQTTASTKSEPTIKKSKTDLSVTKDIQTTASPPDTSSQSKSGDATDSTLATSSSAFTDVTDDALLTSPVEMLKVVKALYPLEAKKANISGKVVMMLLIDETGHVRDVKILSGPGYGLKEAAATAAKSFLFKPAQVKDKKVSVLVRYTYRFDLDHF